MRRRTGLAIALVVLALFTLDLLTRPPRLPDYAATRTAYRPSEAWLYDRRGRLLDSSRVDFAVRRLGWTPLAAIAPAVPAAVIAAEDRRFARHDGIDWIGVAGAARARLSGEPSRGASTLTMQLAGFLSPGLARPGARGWLDKLRQMRAATAIEARWSKDQILEAYLNLAGYRGEAQGIGAAALQLFGKTPAVLSADDATLLAALLPDPRADPAAVARRACRLTPADCAKWPGLAASMLGPARSLSLDPGLAPHLADRLLTRPGARVRTTLDLDVQRLANAALRRQLAGLGGTRARDGAVVVADAATGDVVAYVGGIGGASTAPAVDGAAAYRQAGSTLKPFLYGQAIERGYLTPASILDDAAVQLDTASGLYVPQNYDRGFKGPVSVRTALAGSLNVPAVRTLLLVGVEPFRDRLWDTGYRGLVEDGAYYGYSLALGSAEVTLMEQVAAYRSLAAGGAWAPLRLDAAAPRVAARPVLSPAAAWIVGDLLADPGARALTFGLDSALRLPFRASVKTGTSKAMRDNWCVGYTDRYVVGVWIGNAEGDSMRAVSGTSGAAPVWRDIMLALQAGRPAAVASAPAGVTGRVVTFAGGIEAARREWFVAGTEQRLVVGVPDAARRPRLTNPAAGAVYALDPDIPADRQRIAIGVSGAADGLRVVLDGRDLGPAGAAPMVFPAPGVHRLRLVDAGGRALDAAIFTVR